MADIKYRLRIPIVIIIVLLFFCHPVSTQAAFLTYEFDDGWASQWTAFEILSKYSQIGVAAVPAIILFKEKQFDKRALSKQQLLTMQSAGWEIVSHSWSHPFFSSMPQTYLDASLIGRHNIHGGTLVFASDSELNRHPSLVLQGEALRRCSTKGGMGNTTGCYFIQPGTGNVVIQPHDGGAPFTAARLRNSVQWELESSKIYLNNLGFNVQNISVPYHDWSSGRARLAELYYNSASVGWSSINGGIANRIPVSDPYWLARVGIASYTSVEKVKNLVTKAIEENKWIILLFHKIGNSGNTYAFSPDKFEELAKWVGEQNIQVVTRQQGLDLSRLSARIPQYPKQVIYSQPIGAQ